MTIFKNDDLCDHIIAMINQEIKFNEKLARDKAKSAKKKAKKVQDNYKL